MSESYAVIGAGPLGSCAARALAERFEKDGRTATIYLIDANDPIGLDFKSLSAAGPHAAGQLMLHVFDADSPAKELTRRSHELLKRLKENGHIDSSFAALDLLYGQLRVRSRCRRPGNPGASAC